MSATLIGTTGNWGVPTDQTGSIIESQSLEYTNKERPVLTKAGETQGLSFYDEQISINLSGLVPTSSAFSGALTSTLTVSNSPIWRSSGIFSCR